MLARQYNRKIKIYTASVVPDGFGGNIARDVLLGSFWAEVKQNSVFTDTSIGNDISKENYTFKIRANSNITEDSKDLTIEYRNKKYVVNGFPKYDDELFRFMTIQAVGNGN